MNGKRRSYLLALSALLVALGLVLIFAPSARAQTGLDRSILSGLNLRPQIPAPGPRAPFLPTPPGAPAPVNSPARPPVNVPVRIRFPVLVRSAGMIFSGTVTGIERHPAASGQAVATVAITFHVESAIRGAASGQDLTISQWIGLWSSGQRYRIGEHVLLFLYAPSKLGLTSSIAGPMGRFELDARGRVMVSAQHLAAFQGDPVLGGKSRLRLSDFALAVQRVAEEE